MKCLADSNNKKSSATPFISLSGTDAKNPVRYDLYDDYELLGNEEKQNNLQDHPDPINVYVHRNLTKGKWSTLCLPFDMSLEQIEKVFGEGTVVSKFVDVDLAGNNINFESQPVIDDEGMKAGKPYLIKSAKSFTYEEPFFVTGVTISMDAINNATLYDENLGYYFTGLLEPAVLQSQVNSNQVPVYISSEQLYKDTGNTPMKGFRAYFKFPSTLPEENSKSMKIALAQNETTIVERVNSDVGKDASVYSISGQRMGTSLKDIPKGIYIQRGKKVVVR